ncbi:MAG: hypothetical protein ABIO86_09620 [Sphingomonas sp.]
MPPPDICDPSTFPSTRYPEQWELPDISNESYTYIRCLILNIGDALAVTEASLSPMAVGGRSFWLTGAEQEDEQDGTLVTAGPSLDDRITNLLAIPLVQRTTPLDIVLQFPTRIVIRLKPNQTWKLPTDRHPFSMKHDFQGKYADLKYHYMDGGSLQSVDLLPGKNPTHDYDCFSFTAGAPCKSRAPLPNVRHGFNVNLDQHTPGFSPMPVWVDPDIENKGDPGHPAPLDE